MRRRKEAPAVLRLWRKSSCGRMSNPCQRFQGQENPAHQRPTIMLSMSQPQSGNQRLQIERKMQSEWMFSYTPLPPPSRQPTSPMYSAFELSNVCPQQGQLMPVVRVRFKSAGTTVIRKGFARLDIAAVGRK